MIKNNKIMNFLFLFLILIVSDNAAYSAELKAESKPFGRIGCLAKLNISPEEYAKMIKNQRKHTGWQLLSENNNDNSKFYFYDSLLLLEMSLERGDIDEAAVPQDIANYMLKVNNKFKFASVEKMNPMELAFGFIKGNEKLRDKFNIALHEMKSHGRLAELHKKYIDDINDIKDIEKLDDVVFEKFPGVEPIMIAVTGDVPPIDYMSDDGEPVGFSTAVLAEIGKILKLNIQLVDIDAGARVAALSSGRVDGVFWFSYISGAEHQPDVPDGIILSDSYYNYDKIMFIKSEK